MAEKWFRYEGVKENNDGNIFFFPHAGSSASFFASWKRYTSGKSCVFPVQYPGRENRRKEVPPLSISSMACEFVNDNLELLQSKPFVLFGHCMGALICWKIALELQKKGIKMPEAVVVSSSSSPVRRAIDRAGNMSEDEILEYLCKMGFVDRSIVKEKEFFDYYISLMKIDMSLLESFDYEGQKGVMINCPIISFNGEDDDRALLKQSLEWKDFTNMGFERELFKGGHFYLRDDPERVVKHLETYF